ncbi:MAG: DUF4349 domain-containing protein [Planctomycetes bacterium]|nr:DUF4349 domain-containing protein [Planctomycetota bacterium]
MSDHTWTEEHVEAYLAGGLTAQEAERLEAHAEECAVCAGLLNSSRALDRELNSLFLDIRPGPELEDRLVNNLRNVSEPRKPVFARWSGRLVAAAAAVLFLGAFGALASSVAENGLPMPGSPKAMQRFSRASGRVHRTPDEIPTGGDPNKDLTNEDPGLQSNLEGALPNIERLDKQNVDGSVTTDDLGQPKAPDVDTAKKLYSLGYSPPMSSYTGDKGKGNEWFARHPDGNFKPADPYSKPVPTKGAEQYGNFNSTGRVELDKAMEEKGAKARENKFAQTEATSREYYDPKAPPLPVVTPVVPGAGPVATVAPPVTPVSGLPAPSATGPAPAPDITPAPREPKKDPIADPNPEPAKRVILRSGNMEFEVPSFDAASATITKSVLGIKGAFIATVNSDKLPNGKVKGSITVRTPPENLDSLVLELRKELGKDGELKGVRISSQDVTKQYTDLESHLRAYRTMETRLIQIIKEGKGEIKQLLEAERELGNWRTKIEETEGELRYYANLAALSTLVITLTEKEIRAAATLTENERVQAGVEVDDVDKTYQEILKAILEAKGHIIKSEVKQLTAGQFSATLNFEVPPDAAGPMRDRLKQLGRIARLEIDRVQNPEGGTLPTNAKLTRGDTMFMVQLYNLANIAPRETTMLHIAVADVSAALQSLRDVVGKATSRVFTARFDEQDKSNPTAQLDFEVRRTDDGAVRAALEAAGETFSRQLTRAPESDNVTDTKVLYRISVISMAKLRPRETATMSVAVNDVPAAYQALRAAAGKTTSRVLNAQINEQDRQNISANLDIDVKKADEPAIRTAFDASGEVLSRQTTRAPDNETATDSKTLYRITIISMDRLRPRETATLNVAVVDVPAAYQALRDAIGKANGRVLNAQINEQDRQNITAHLDLDVKRTDEAAVRAAFDAAGDVLSRQVTRVPESDSVTDSKVRYTASLVPANRLKPRETTTLGIEVSNVEETATLFAAQAAEVKGRQGDPKFTRDSSGKTIAKLVFDVPLTAAAGLVERFKSAGTVRSLQSVRDSQATDGKFATARIEVTLGNRDSIVADEDGLTSQVRRGLSYSATVLLTSVTWVIFGLCVLLPWAIIGYVVYRVIRRAFFATATPAAEMTPTPTAPPPATA